VCALHCTREGTELIQGNVETSHELSNEITAVGDSDYAIPKHVREWMIQEREHLAEELSLRGFTVPQLHVATRLDMGASDSKQDALDSQAHECRRG
jgi:hypothetical protein